MPNIETLHPSPRIKYGAGSNPSRRGASEPLSSTAWGTPGKEQRGTSLAKAGQILVSQRTYSKVKSLVEVEKVGIIQVQGLRDPVVTYNVKIH